MTQRFFVYTTLICSILLSLIPTNVNALDPEVNIGFQQIISGLSSPVGIENAGDSSERLFIVQAGGQIVIYDGMQLLATPFLDISNKVTAGGEQGLLGLAFHPNYETNGLFYINYTRTSSNQLQTVIAEYEVSANPNDANEASERILLTINQDSTNHNGGQIAFGPDGYLYIAMGDGGGGGDPSNRAQDPNSLLGKMLRIDVNSGNPYNIPTNNPFTSNASVRDEIWAFGLRNPWRFSFDKTTGNLFIADVGQGDWEEVNVQLSTSTGAENYGWSCYEGTHTYDNSRDCDNYNTVLTDPKIEYAHGANDSNGCSITGGYVYRGLQYPEINGLYFYGDFCTGKVWIASENASVWTSELVLDTSYLISTFGQDENGELYLASYGEGKIYKLYVSTFADVPPFHWASSYILSIYNEGITGGCASSPLRYCPNNTVNRAQMAVFLMKAINGSSYTPPTATGTVFTDVPSNGFAAAFIEAFAAEGITGGCGGGNYCPNNLVTRGQMAVFLLKAKHGSSYVPPVATGDFADVPINHAFAPWIEQLAAEGITGGCGGGNYCPNNAVTRAQMAVFLQKTFNLPLP